MRSLNHRVDRKIFANTARKTRRINLMRFIPRGGIRL